MISSTGLTLAGAARGCRGFTAALLSRLLWSCVRRFSRDLSLTKWFENAPFSSAKSVTFEPRGLSAAGSCLCGFPLQPGEHQGHERLARLARLRSCASYIRIGSSDRGRGPRASRPDDVALLLIELDRVP
jgi:hypothetical protein